MLASPPEKRGVSQEHGSRYPETVTDAAAALLRQALELAPQERADLAAELLASLEPAEDPETVQRLWAEELVKRAQEIQSGETAGIDAEVVFQQVKDKLAQVRKSAR